MADDAGGRMWWGVRGKPIFARDGSHNVTSEIHEPS
jgi:hypothetical protein